VGPILSCTGRIEAVLTALKKLNPGIRVIDRGSYIRVLVPNQCVLTREALERITGAKFDLLHELEQLMCSFQGRLHLTQDEARWECE
jgi:hypothetical protein